MTPFLGHNDKKTEEDKTASVWGKPDLNVSPPSLLDDSGDLINDYPAEKSFIIRAIGYKYSIEQIRAHLEGEESAALALYQPRDVAAFYGRTADSVELSRKNKESKQLGYLSSITGLSSDEVKVRVRSAESLGVSPNVFLKKENDGLYSKLAGHIKKQESFYEAAGNAVRSQILSDRKAKLMLELDDPLNNPEVAAINKELESLGPALMTEGFKKHVAGTVGMITQQLNNRRAFTYGAAGIAGGAAIGTAAGGGLLSPVTAPIGAASVGTVAFATGYALDNFYREAGGAKEEFLSVVDENGKPIDPKIATVFAYLSGAASMSVDFLQLGTLAKQIPGAEKIVGALTRTGIKKMLAVPTLRKAIAKAFVAAGIDFASEVTQEGIQRSIVVVGREYAKWAANELSGQAFEVDGITKKAVTEGIKEAKEAVYAFGGFGLMGLGKNLAIAPRAVKLARIENMANAFAIGSVASTEKHGGSYVYIPEDMLAKHASPEVLEKLGVKDQMNLGDRTEVAVDAEVYKKTIAENPDLAGVFEMDARFGATGVTPREVAEHIASSATLDTRIEADTDEGERVRSIVGNVHDFLVKSGQDEALAADNARIYGRYVLNKSDMYGVSLEEADRVAMNGEWGAIKNDQDAVLFQSMDKDVDLKRSVSVMPLEENTRPTITDDDRKSVVSSFGSGVVNKDTGIVVTLSGNGANHARHSAVNENGEYKQVLMSAFFKMPELVKNAVRVKTTEDRKISDRNMAKRDGSVKAIRRFLSPVRYGDSMYVLKITTKEYVDGKAVIDLDDPKSIEVKLYDQAIGKEIKTAPAKSGANEEIKDLAHSTLSSAEAVRYLSIGELAVNVKDSLDADPYLTKEEYEEQTGERYSLEQKGRASVFFDRSSGKAIIRLAQTADASSFIHELSHVMLDDLISYGSLESASDQVKADLEAALDYLSIADMDLSVPFELMNKEQQLRFKEAQEKWARSNEAYMMKGVAPSSELRGIFARMRARFMAIYRELKSLAVELTPEIEGVFSRILASDFELKYDFEKNATIDSIKSEMSAVKDEIADLEEKKRVLTEARDGSAPAFDVVSDQYVASHEGSTYVALDDLTPTEPPDAAGVSRAREHMQEAAEGRRDKRPPLIVCDRGDGTYSVIDGNNTLEALRELGAQSVPVVVAKNLYQKNVLSIDDLYAKAEEAAPEFNALLSSLGAELGAEVVAREGLKSRERTTEKIERHYGGKASRVLDVLAGSLVFDSTEQMGAAFERLKSDPRVARIKDKWTTPDTDTGYRDINLSVRLSNGMISEVQLHHRGIMEVKNSLGHLLYEFIRVNDEVDGMKPYVEQAEGLSRILYEAGLHGASSHMDANFIASASDISRRLLVKSATHDLGTLLSDLSGMILNTLGPSSSESIRASVGSTPISIANGMSSPFSKNLSTLNTSLDEDSVAQGDESYNQTSLDEHLRQAAQEGKLEARFEDRLTRQKDTDAINKEKQAVRYEVRLEEFADKMQGRLDDMRIQRNIAKRVELIKKAEAIAKINERIKRLKEKQKKLQAHTREVRKMLKGIANAKNAKKVSWDIRLAIKEFLDKYDLNNRSKKTLETRSELIAFIEEEPDIISSMHPDDLKYLGTVTLNDLKLEGLRELRDKVVSMKEEGAREYLAWEAEERERRDKILYELSSILPRDKKTRLVEMNRKDRQKEYKGVKGKLAKAGDWVYSNTLGCHRFFDWIDGGGSKYKGAYVKFFVDTVNAAKDKELVAISGRRAWMETRLQSLGLSIRDFKKTIEVMGEEFTVDELMSVYGWMKNEETSRALLNGNFRRFNEAGGDPEVLAAACINALGKANPNYFAAADLVIEEYALHKDRINRAMIDTYGEGMFFVENYTPSNRLEYASRQGMIDAQTAEGMAEASADAGGVAGIDKGFSNSRKNIKDENQTPMEAGMFSMWLDHVSVTEHVAASGKVVRDINFVMRSKLENNRSFASLITDNFGRDAWDYMTNYHNVVVRDDVALARSVLDGFGQFFARNMAVAYLAGNLGTALKNLFSLPRFLISAGPVRLVSSIGQWMSNPFGFLESVYEMDPQMRNRKPNALVQAVMDSGEWGGELHQQAIQVLMAPIALCDRWTAAIGWKATYDDCIDNGLSHAEAVREAQRAVALTQQSPHAKDLPRIWQQSGWVKLAMIFTSDAANTLGMTAYDLVQQLKTGQIPGAVKTVFGLTLTALLIQALEEGVPDDDDEDEWGKWIAKAIAKQTLSALPLVGKELVDVWDIAVGERKFRRDSYSPVTAPLAKLTEAARLWADAADDSNALSAEKKESRALWLVIEGVSLGVLPFPVTGTRRTIQAFNEVANGNKVDAIKILVGQRRDIGKVLGR